MRNAQGTIFQQDVTILKAQQKAIGRHPERRLAQFSIDFGGTLARRVIDRVIKRSHGAAIADDAGAE